MHIEKQRVIQEPPLLLFDDVVKTYGEKTVVDHITLPLYGRTITALAGVNGSGKSTLFRIAAGFVKASHGAVVIAERGVERISLLDKPPSSRVRLGLNYLSQQRRVLCGLSTLETLRVAKAAVTQERHIAADVIFKCLEELRLMSLLGMRPLEMSASDVVLLLLAKAHLMEPKFFIVDEPFAGLDARARDHCSAIIRKMRDRGAGILITDHNPNALLEIAETVHIMERGRLVFSDSVIAALSSSEAQRLYFRKYA